jgi:hypothetical protein
MSRKRIAALIAVGVITFVALTVMDAVVGEAAGTVVEFGDTGAAVVEVQRDLAAVGYSVPAVGTFGPRTLRAVRHFQRANGLTVDGIVGSATQRALDAAQAPTATAPAVRLTTPVPAAPAAPGPCGEWADEIAYFGLPASFANIVYRESRCRPDVTSNTGCCHGLAQIHRIHLPKPECRAYSVDDLFDPGVNLCVASVLYKRSGMAPWSL